MQKNSVMRSYGRAYNQLRPVTLSHNLYGYAPGSVLLTMGDTKILCNVHIQNGVPPFLKGTKTGWLTAEYGMLPAATQQRTQRETAAVRTNGRTVEIARFIGRSLRTIVELDKIGERTIMIDCDVLQADGSTRTASITAANYALLAAQEQWLQQGLIQEPIVSQQIAAVSVGIQAGAALLDLDYREDSSIDADFNVVLTESGDIVEMQGTAEKQPVSWQQFEAIKSLAMHGVQQLFERCAVLHDKQKTLLTASDKQQLSSHHRPALFSLQNR